MANQQTYEERIKDIHDMLNGQVNLVTLTNYCMNLKVSEFNQLERDVMIFSETGNIDELDKVAYRILM